MIGFIAVAVLIVRGAVLPVDPIPCRRAEEFSLRQARFRRTPAVSS